PPLPYTTLFRSRRRRTISARDWHSTVAAKLLPTLTRRCANRRLNTSVGVRQPRSGESALSRISSRRTQGGLRWLRTVRADGTKIVSRRDFVFQARQVHGRYPDKHHATIHHSTHSTIFDPIPGQDASVAAFLVSTSPRFARGEAGGSDYLLGRLDVPGDTHKRL